jgi:hypothetical protein
MQGQINIVDLSFAPFTYVNDSLTSYYSKTAIDASLNDNFYNKTTSNSTFLAKSNFDSSMNANYYAKSVIDGSINSVLGSYALLSSLDSYYTKNNADLSINSLLGSYSTKDYVDVRFTTLVGTISTDKLDTLAEIANALQGDASFGLTVYDRINSCDSSINTIRTNLSNSDSSINTIRTNFSNYVSSTDSSINTIRSTYATTASLSAYLQAGSTNDVSLNGNVQLGGGSRSVGINKTPNVLYALDISGSTNMSGNLTLTKAASVTMGSFDLSSVNMSVFNVSEKYTNVTLSATPTLDYSTGGIFYMAGVNAALTAISITNVPTALNRSISITLILAQTGGSGTFCFTTGTLNVNGTSITYLKPDATALVAPTARALIINQFIIVWQSATPTVIAYLSSMG